MMAGFRIHQEIEVGPDLQTESLYLLYEQRTLISRKELTKNKV